MRDLSRRDFLKVSVLVGAAVTGCTRLPETTTPTALPLAVSGAYELADNAVDYGPYAAGCSAYALGGAIQDGNGQGLGGLPVRINYELSDLETTVRTSEDGTFLVEVVGDMSNGATYYVQVLDPNNLDRTLSEVVTVEAIPDCNLNHMTMVFIPAQP